ncbi:MAG: hypothetical protein Fur0011_4290 [Candidatus Microgenomates bacterium]
MMKTRSGQVGLLLLVVMGLIVGIALSLASRSLGDTVLSRQESESAKAFRLAESGVEQALNTLRQNTTITTTLNLSGDGDFRGTTSIGSLNSYGLYVKEGEQAHLDVGSFAPGNLTIKWTKETDVRENPSTCSAGSGNSPAAIEIVAHKSDGTANFSYINPYSCTPEINGFGNIAVAGNEGYRSSATYSVVAGTVAVRIRPLYSDSTIAVSGEGLTTQLYLIQSKAAGGDAQKEIEVKRGLDAPASVFDFALFSGSSIEK